MNRLRIWAILGAAIVSAGGANSSASASIVEAVYTGTIYYGSDVSGLFGPSGTNLAGDAYAVTFLFDTTRGTSQFTQTNYFVEGSPVWGTVSPALEVVVTINGHSVSFTAPYLGLTAA
jgi:hypothetical protein